MKSTDNEFAVAMRHYQKAEQCLLELELHLRDILKRIKGTNVHHEPTAKPEYRVWDRVDAILSESTNSKSKA